MKRPFEVGDRVRVYRNYPNIDTGEIIHFYDDGAISYRHEIDLKEYIAYPKQCRRLIPKKRRSVWVFHRCLELKGEQCECIHVNHNPRATENWTEFVERKPK